MFNILDIVFDRIENLNQIEIYHNGTNITDNCKLVQHQITATVESLDRENVLEIKNCNNKKLMISSITMFDIGQDKLVFEGKIVQDDEPSYQSQEILPNDTWQLTYSSPVFLWLHKTLDHGWLLKN